LGQWQLWVSPLVLIVTLSLLLDLFDIKEGTSYYEIHTSHESSCQLVTEAHKVFKIKIKRKKKDFKPYTTRPKMNYMELL
jgi:hypothetical protein